MSILITALTFILILSILVVVHEWGHFIVARIFGIRVDEFSLGFGPRAIRVGKRGDTEYNVRWIPLGGYVKIAGMDPDEEPILRVKDKITGRDKGGEVPLVAENTPDKAETDVQVMQDTIDGFYTKPLWQRSLVIFAGPFMSFMLGYVVLCLMFWVFGLPAPSIGTVKPNTEAQKIGLMAHDRVVKIDGQAITDADQMVTIIHSHLNKPMTLVIARQGQNITLQATPQLLTDDKGKPILIDGKKAGMLGFTPGIAWQKIGFVSAVREGTNETREYLAAIWHLIASHRLGQIRKNAGGPIFIAQVTGMAVQGGPPAVIEELAELSLSLALFNLLPIPILDGGHLLEFAIEKIRSGRRMTPEQKQNFMLAGLAVIGLLFVLIMFNDILRAVHHQMPQ